MMIVIKWGSLLLDIDYESRVDPFVCHPTTNPTGA